MHYIGSAIEKSNVFFIVTGCIGTSVQVVDLVLIKVAFGLWIEERFALQYELLIAKEDKILCLKWKLKEALLNVLN